MATLTAEYLSDYGRVRLTAGALTPNVVYRIERSTDGGVSWTTVRGATNITDAGVTVVYDYEYEPNTLNEYRLIAPAISDTFERTTGPGALVLTGASGAYSSTTDKAALDITGDIDIRAVISLPDYSNGAIQTIVAKYVTGTNQRSYGMRVSATGFLQMVFSTNGTAGNTGTSTVDLYSAGIADGDIIAIRVTRAAATGIITFYTGNPAIDSVTWVQLGATVTGTTGNLFVGTAPLEVGSASVGTGDRATGRIMAARVLNGISGTAAANPNFADQTTGTTSFADAAANTWTVNGAATIEGNDTAWGSADTGQPWLLSPESLQYATHFFVADGVGQALSAAFSANSHGRYINGTWDDLEGTVDVMVPSGANNTIYRLILRSNGGAESNEGYAGNLEFDTTGNAIVSLSGLPSTISVTLGAWQVGQRWRIRMRAVGTTVEIRAWNTATTEPSTWQISTSSTNHASGSVSLGFVPGTPPVTQMVDNLVLSTVPATAAATASVLVEQSDVWLKSIEFPTLNRALGCVATGPRTRRSRIGLFDVKGRHPVLAIADVGSTETFTLIFVTTSVAENQGMVALLTYGPPLFLQSPPDDDPSGCGRIAAYPTGWFAPGDSVQARPLRGERAWEWQVPMTRIAAPDPQAVTPANITWSVLWQIVNTWEDLWDQWSTWGELWDATIAPDVFAEGLAGGEGL